MSISTELPAAFFFLCLLIGAGFALFLYYKKLKEKGADGALWQIRLLAALRFLSATLLAILLLNPLLKYLQREVEKPAVIVAIDNSLSMLMSGDSAKTRKQINDLLSEFQKKLSDKYEVIPVLAGEGVKPYAEVNFKDVSTDLSGAFTERELVYAGDNLSAQILISDGIVNQGVNPTYLPESKVVPVYSIGIGDTNVRLDARVYEAKANEITFLGNTFPIEVVVNADKCGNRNLELSLFHDGSKVSAINLAVSGNRFSSKHTFLVKADKVGTRQYEVRVGAVNGEYNLQNNRKLIYTEVMDGRQKIALVARAPHPDIAAIKSMVEGNDQYELTVFLNTFPAIKKGDFDLVITHQLPQNNGDFNFLKQLRDLGIPAFNIIGTQTDIALFNRLETGIAISGNRRNYNQVLPNRNSSFSLFDLSTGFESFLAGLPPLTSPFGEYQTASKAGVLFYQRIGQVNSEIPLWYLQEQNGRRSGVLAGEGIWRWKLNNFELNDNFERVNELMSRTIQYLSIKSDQRKFRLYTSSRSFFENEPVSFFADVYNDSYEFTPDADVRLRVVDEAGKEYTYALSPSEGMYRLRLGVLPAGRYAYSGTATYNGKVEKAAGFFTVKEVNLESQNLTANFGWMRQLSEQSGGAFYSPDQVDQLIESLNSRKDAQAISHSSYNLKDVIDQKWIFFIIVLVLGAEWFIRRWTGGY